MAAGKRSNIFVCGKDDEAMMRYFKMLNSETSSSGDEMECDNIRPVAANQSPASDNERDNSSLESGEDNTAVNTSCGDVVAWKWEQSLVEPMCHPFSGVSGIRLTLNLDNNSSRAAIFLLYLNDNIVVHIVEYMNK
ncbi:hypothetical protein PR048_005391 [Dryococelus australis]|uniref:Uncharacterized protein n=1 Tax=Dryococelus australis TaxID=614101 RepID=A0ABQ9I971_9NEOP|nr:hypothetical protein PR048_005391 [Dryococelus australis]